LITGIAISCCFGVGLGVFAVCGCVACCRSLRVATNLRAGHQAVRTSEEHLCDNWMGPTDDAVDGDDDVVDEVDDDHPRIKDPSEQCSLHIVRYKAPRKRKG